MAERSCASNLVASDTVVGILVSAQAYCFDVDSTLVTEERIDHLAEFKGVGSDVAAMTAQAMTGQILFQDALTARLNIIRPSTRDIDLFLTERPSRFSEGVVDLVALLHHQGKQVYLVSGGFRQMIEPLADILNIPHDRIYANRLVFDDTGTFLGYDPQEMTCRDGGKACVIKHLMSTHGFTNVVMIGDGVTDMQARPPASVFVGYGGVVNREKVRVGADWFIEDFRVLTTILQRHSKSVC